MNEGSPRAKSPSDSASSPSLELYMFESDWAPDVEDNALTATFSRRYFAAPCRRKCDSETWDHCERAISAVCDAAHSKAGQSRPERDASATILHIIDCEFSSQALAAYHRAKERILARFGQFVRERRKGGQDIVLLVSSKDSRLRPATPSFPPLGMPVMPGRPPPGAGMPGRPPSGAGVPAMPAMPAIPAMSPPLHKLRKIRPMIDPGSKLYTKIGASKASCIEIPSLVNFSSSSRDLRKAVQIGQLNARRLSRLLRHWQVSSDWSGVEAAVTVSFGASVWPAHVIISAALQITARTWNRPELRLDAKEIEYVLTRMGLVDPSLKRSWDLSSRGRLGDHDTSTSSASSSASSSTSSSVSGADPGSDPLDGIDLDRHEKTLRDCLVKRGQYPFHFHKRYVLYSRS